MGQLRYTPKRRFRLAAPIRWVLLFSFGAVFGMLVLPMLPDSIQQNVENGQSFVADLATGTERCIMAADSTNSSLAPLALVFGSPPSSLKSYWLPIDPEYEENQRAIEMGVADSLGTRIRWFNNEPDAIEAGYSRGSDGRRTGGTYDCDED